MAELKLPKLKTRVRFPSPAPSQRRLIWTQAIAMSPPPTGDTGTGFRGGTSSGRSVGCRQGSRKPQRQVNGAKCATCTRPVTTSTTRPRRTGHDNTAAAAARPHGRAVHGCLSRMQGNLHLRFLGGRGTVRYPSYPTSYEGSIPFTRSTSLQVVDSRGKIQPRPPLIRRRSAGGAMAQATARPGSSERRHGWPSVEPGLAQVVDRGGICRRTTSGDVNVKCANFRSLFLHSCARAPMSTDDSVRRGK